MELLEGERGGLPEANCRDSHRLNSARRKVAAQRTIALGPAGNFEQFGESGVFWHGVSVE
jgi:hypothetical protein